MFLIIPHAHFVYRAGADPGFPNRGGANGAHLPSAKSITVGLQGPLNIRALETL